MKLLLHLDQSHTRHLELKTAPGGVMVFDPEARHLGTIVTREFASNVAFGPEKKTLYITADMLLLRVKLR